MRRSDSSADAVYLSRWMFRGPFDVVRHPPIRSRRRGIPDESVYQTPPATPTPPPFRFSFSLSSSQCQGVCRRASFFPLHCESKSIPHIHGMTLLCVPLVAKTVEQMMADMAAAKAHGADVVEIRLDHLSDFEPRRDLHLLVGDRPLPVLVTYRSRLSPLDKFN
ncbi:hypothetical protein BHE74_00016308 [Ensete ventricosum]|nr:hypothetical protein BHE74_00016308 [Ensete ventricosum]